MLFYAEEPSNERAMSAGGEKQRPDLSQGK